MDEYRKVVSGNSKVVTLIRKGSRYHDTYKASVKKNRRFWDENSNATHSQRERLSSTGGAGDAADEATAVAGETQYWHSPDWDKRPPE